MSQALDTSIEDQPIGFTVKDNLQSEATVTPAEALNSPDSTEWRGAMSDSLSGVHQT